MLKIKIGNKINKISDEETINLENKKLIKTSAVELTNN